MIRLDSFINIFIQTEGAELLTFSTDNATWPQGMRSKTISIKNLLASIYKETNYRDILEQRIKRIEPIIPLAGFQAARNDIETIAEYKVSHTDGLHLVGYDKDGNEKSANVELVLEIVLDCWDYDQE